MSRFYGFWKQLDREAYRLPKDTRSSEFWIERNGQIKYWAVVKLSESDIPEANRASVARDGAFVISIHGIDMEVLRECVEKSIRAKGNASAAVCMEYVHERGGICLYPCGGFDDAEVSVYVLGAGDLIALFPDASIAGIKN